VSEYEQSACLPSFASLKVLSLCDAIYCFYTSSLVKWWLSSCPCSRRQEPWLQNPIAANGFGTESSGRDQPTIHAWPPSANSPTFFIHAKRLKWGREISTCAR